MTQFAEPPAARPAPKGWLPQPPWRTIRAWKGAAFAAPFFLGFIFTFAIPLAYAISQSFFTQQRTGLGLGPATNSFAGFSQYGRVLHDEAFWTAIARVTVFAAVQIPIALAIALGMALAIDAIRQRMTRLFRFAFLIPHMIPGIVATLIWVYLYSPSIGPLTGFASALGFDVNFFSAQMLWISVGNLLTWGGVGFTMLILYGAIQSTPKELFDAARVDGASELQIAFHIKVPQARGTLVLTGMLSIIGMLQIFAEPVLFRSVSPESVSRSFTPIMIIFYSAFTDNNYNYAAALSVVLALVVGSASYLFYRATNETES